LRDAAKAAFTAMTISVIRLGSQGKETSIVLFEHEFQNLLEALRRDFRQEENQSHGNSKEENFIHKMRMRQDKHLLDALQPKTSRPVIKQVKVEDAAEAQMQAFIASTIVEVVVQIQEAEKGL